jgi:hypothetical protein
MPETVLVWRENPLPQFERILPTLRAVARELRARDGGDQLRATTN